MNGGEQESTSIKSLNVVASGTCGRHGTVAVSDRVKGGPRMPRMHARSCHPGQEKQGARLARLRSKKATNNGHNREGPQTLP